MTAPKPPLAHLKWILWNVITGVAAGICLILPLWWLWTAFYQQNIPVIIWCLLIQIIGLYFLAIEPVKGN